MSLSLIERPRKLFKMEMSAVADITMVASILCVRA
ncbi:hypothetical protein N175_12195 [Vibrio anguillarum M3]|nr:hypothetical protein N175_12195 [Vibrio anguillarum M3]